MSDFSYKDDLYDVYAEVSKKFVNAQTNIANLVAFLKGQGAQEEALGKQTQKAILETDTQLGEINGPLNMLLFFAQQTGEKRMAMGPEMSKKINADLSLLASDIKKQLNAFDKDEAKIRKEYKEACTSCIKAKGTDEEKKKAFEKAKIESIQNKDLKPKQVESLAKKVADSEKSSQKAEADYKTAVEKQNKAREVYYKSLGGIMDQLEQFDKRRVNQMQNILKCYCALEEKFIHTLDETVAKMNKSFDDLDPQKDIVNFITKNKTGAKRPPVETFEPVDIKIPKELNVPKYPTDISERAHKFKSNLDKSNQSFSKQPSSYNMTPNGTTNDSTPIKVDDPVEDVFATLGNTVLKQVTSNYDYEPQNSEELKLAQGQLIDVLRITEDGWWIGSVNGKRGYFPSNFVSELGSDTPIDETPLQPQVKVAEVVTSSAKVLCRCKALYPYEPQDAAELPLKEGDDIIVYEKNEDGWWFGEANGVKGLFPSNYVE